MVDHSSRSLGDSRIVAVVREQRFTLKGPTGKQPRVRGGETN